MKLKTLKDLHRFEDLKHQDHFIVSSALLKQEAIKHIKNGEENIRDTLITEVEEWNKAQIRWIKHFFNITEEDLK